MKLIPVMLSAMRGEDMPHEASRNVSVAVLGAGLGGLAAAQRLRELGCHVEVYERNTYVGGRAYSHQVDGFVFDQGPHVSFTKRPEVRSLFAQAVEGKFLEHGAKVWNYWQGHRIQHPAQCNLYGLPLDVVTSCVVDLAKAQHESKPMAKTYADWCFQSLGRAFSSKFVFPYTRKYWTTDATNMSADWVGDRVYSPKLEDVVRGALGPDDKKYHYITHFRYPSRGGFGAYIQAVAANQNVQVNHKVAMVDLQHRKLEFVSGRKAYFDVLISSLPVPELIQRIKDVPRSVSKAAERLTCTSVVLVDVGIERNEGFPDFHWEYFYDEDIIFARANFLHNLSSNNVPQGCGSIQIEVYHSKYRPLPCQDVLNRAIEDLHRVGLLRKDDRILVAEERHIQYANVLFDLDRARNLAIIQKYLAKQGVISCGRYGEWAYYWSDDSIVSGWRAAECAKKECK